MSKEKPLTWVIHMYHGEECPETTLKDEITTVGGPWFDTGLHGVQVIEKSYAERLEREKEKMTVFFEQFGDLSNCYDAEDIVRLGKVGIEQLESRIENLRTLVEKIDKRIDLPWVISENRARLWLEHIKHDVVEALAEDDKLKGGE